MKDQEHENGKSGVNRRDFLRLGIVAPAALVSSCGWDGGPVI